MARKLPAEAFADYVALGPARSYRAIAERYGVSKKAVTQRALKERWQERAAEIEQKAAQAGEQKAAEGLAETNDRHQKIVRAITGKALEALRGMPLRTAMDAVRSLNLAIRLERSFTPGLEPDGGEDVNDGFLPARLSGQREAAFMKYVLQTPHWMSNMLPTVGHWEDKAPKDEQSIVSLVMALCHWVDRIADEYRFDPVMPFHQDVLIAFSVEKDALVVADMRERVFRLEGELKAYLAAHASAVQYRWLWDTFSIRRPRHARNGVDMQDNLRWRDAFGIDADDPVSFIARKLREGGFGVLEGGTAEVLAQGTEDDEAA